MGILRTCRLGVLLTAFLSPGSAAATDLVGDPKAQLRFLAVCAGRLSALTEHQWMFDGPASEVTARQNQAVVAVLDGILPPEQKTRAMGWRIEAKVAHRALLSSAVFSRDSRRATASLRQADRLIAPCTAMFLG